ncbi:MAG: hypothetical protein AAF845_13955 [Bacteroidota bacterium]
MTLTPDILRSLVAKALATRPQEMTCDECGPHLDRFAEVRLAGRDTPEALSLVEAHVAECSCCQEEFEALVTVLREVERDEAPWWRRLLPS